MKQKIRNLLRRLVLVVAALTIGMNLYLWNANSLVGDQLPMPFGYGAAVVLTGSMGDTLPIDSLIFVKAQSECEPGQIAVYQSGHSLIVHRVMSVDGATVITKGDANNTEDEPIEISAIRGIVVGHIPWVGVIVRGIKTPVGTVCVLVLAIWLVEMSNRKERKDDDEELERIKAQIRALKEEKTDSEE